MPRDFRPGGDPSGGLYVDVNPYPRPRTNRGRGIPTNNATPVTAQIPNARLWSFNIEANVINRQSRSASPRFVGPVWLDALVYSNLAKGRTTPLDEFSLFYQSTPYVTVFNSTTITLPTGTAIFEHTRGGAAEDTASPTRITTTPDLFNVASSTWRLGKYIPDPEVFIVACYTALAAGAGVVYGTLRVLENVDADTLGQLMAS
jgi:hypothetical protein